MKQSKLILPTIVISQFCGTSLWFAGNGVMMDLMNTFNLTTSALGHLTSSVQLGFIAGTLCFAILTIADRHSPSKVFLISALLASFFNLGIVWNGNTLASIITLRFFTGFFLAGIYPVGMKIAADYYEKGLGTSLGFIVGALVLGTAFPHLLKDLTHNLPWKIVILVVSGLAACGGILMFLLVPNGPFRKESKGFNASAFFNVFKQQKFRSAAFGYFGHMWELYAFWAFVPVMLKTYQSLHPYASFNIPLLSFLVIGLGGFSCVIGGYLSQFLGVKRTASLALFLSCVCCLISPLLFTVKQENVFVLFLFVWGLVVIADSPLFSTLVAQNAPSESKGTGLTIVNCIGFSVTIISIQLINGIQEITNSTFMYMLLGIGPVAGLIALKEKTRVQPTKHKV